MPCPPETIQTPRRSSALVLAGWLLLCFATGAVAYLFSGNNLASGHNISAWYAGLAKPRLTPPNEMFAPVWVVLYALMAVAAWLVWKTRPSSCRRNGLRLFCVQLWFNLLWAWIFFDRHQIGIALLDLIVLWIAIALTVRSFRIVSHTAAWLMVPYLAWVTFAMYLNFGIWRLN